MSGWSIASIPGKYNLELKDLDTTQRDGNTYVFASGYKREKELYKKIIKAIGHKLKIFSLISANDTTDMGVGFVFKKKNNYIYQIDKINGSSPNVGTDVAQKIFEKYNIKATSNWRFFEQE